MKNEEIFQEQKAEYTRMLCNIVLIEHKGTYRNIFTGL